MKKTIVLLFILSYCVLNAQTKKDTIRENFQNINQMPYICHGNFQVGKHGCGEALFWEIVIQKDRVIEDLIELLDDINKSQAYFPNYGGSMKVADIAQIALEEIIQPLPQPNNFFKIESIDDSQWMANINWLKKNYKNRVAYKKAIKRWHKKNKKNLTWVSSSTFMCGDLQGEHPNKGHYQLNKK